MSHSIRTLTARSFTLLSTTALLMACSAGDDPDAGFEPDADETGQDADPDAGGEGSGGASPSAGGSGPTAGGSESGGTSSGGNESGSGGESSAGGATGAGGATSAGGTTGAGGAVGAGGATGTGGASSSGGATGSGGGDSGGGSCTLTQDRLRITEIDVGRTVVNNEDERALAPLSISPLPSGGSRLAWMSNDGQVHVTTLNAQDQITGSSFAFPANSFADIHADDAGGVVLVTRDAAGSGDKHCGTLTNLCGPANQLPSQWACWDMYLVRFNTSGSETWATRLTSSTDRPPYLNGPSDSQRSVFIWEAYAHHGRIAFDGSNYASYFGAAISVSENCVGASAQTRGVNIHQGDRMQVVGPSGSLVTNKGGFDWGCSHSGYERVVWDENAKKFTAVCKTDNNNRIAFAPNYTTILPIDLWYSNLGDLVTNPQGGLWLTTSNIRPGQTANSNGAADVFLLGFSTGAATHNSRLSSGTGANARAPHLASYGAEHMIAAWETSSANGDLRSNDQNRKLQVQALKRRTGAALGAPLEAAVRGNRYQEFVGFPDGSAAYPAPGSSTTKIKILRVLPCED